MAAPLPRTFASLEGSFGRALRLDCSQQTANMRAHLAAPSSRAFASLEDSFRLCRCARFSVRRRPSTSSGAGCGKGEGRQLAGAVSCGMQFIGLASGLPRHTSGRCAEHAPQHCFAAVLLKPSDRPAEPVPTLCTACLKDRHGQLVHAAVNCWAAQDRSADAGGAGCPARRGAHHRRHTTATLLPARALCPLRALRRGSLRLLALTVRPGRPHLRSHGCLPSGAVSGSSCAAGWRLACSIGSTQLALQVVAVGIQTLQLRPQLGVALPQRLRLGLAVFAPCGCCWRWPQLDCLRPRLALPQRRRWRLSSRPKGGDGVGAGSSSCGR